MSEPTSDPLWRSIEVEYWIVEKDGSFTNPGGLVDASPETEREFVEPVLEVETTSCGSVTELHQELHERPGDMLLRAEKVGKRLVLLAMPVSDEMVTELEGDRTRVQNRAVGLGFQYARYCVGTHVHVEQRLGREIDQYSAFVALDPALAFVNSSPYYDGERLTAGARSKLHHRMTCDDVLHQGRLWHYADDARGWPRRLERRFEEFFARAEGESTGRATVEADFGPESAIWTPVQLRAELGTVKWRSPDCSFPNDALRPASSIANVAKRLDDVTFKVDGDSRRVTDDRAVFPEFDTMLRYVNVAIEDGLSSETARSYPDRMGLDIGAYSPVSHEIDGREMITAAEAREL